MTVQEALEQGIRCQHMGLLAEAEDLYRRAVAAAPQEPSALHLLGLLLHQTRRDAEAIPLLRRAIEVDPRSPDYRNTLANVLRGQGALVEAEALLRVALELEPGFLEAHVNLGNVLGDLGRLDEAVGAFVTAIGIDGRCVEAHVGLGRIYQKLNRTEDAIAEYRAALTLRPDLSQVWYNLGLALESQDRIDQALEAYQQALAIRPDYAEAFNNLGNLLQAKGDLRGAAEAFESAVKWKPDFAEAHFNLGNAAREARRLEDAVVCYRRALSIRPEMAWAHENLGVVLQLQGRLGEAAECYRRAVAISGRPSAHDSLLMLMNYWPDVDPAAVYGEHLNWARLHEAPLISSIRPHANDRDPDRRLRIGFVSADFHLHSVMFFAEPIIRGLDRGQFEVYCYSNRRQGDAVTERLRNACQGWRQIERLSDAQAAELIREDRIDILVDLSGHTAGNRLLVFARKPAPVQVTHIGYPNTSGLSGMDAWISDPRLDPEDRPTPCSERLIRLGEAFACYLPPEGAPAPAEPPMLANSFITLGSFNTVAKLNEKVIGLWARLLRRIPTARLLLKTGSLADSAVRDRIRGVFESQGVEGGRLLLEGAVDFHEHLAHYHRVDLQLDPFPFNGHTTTLHGLWMGVPVVTLMGNTHAGRRGAMLLRNLGLGELIAAGEEDYIRIVAELADAPDRIRELRAGMRDRVAGCPLTAQHRHVAELTCVYRELWREWCAR